MSQIEYSDFTQRSSGAMWIAAAFGASLAAAGATFLMANAPGALGAPSAGLRPFPELRSFFTRVPSGSPLEVAPFVLHAANPAEQDRAVRCLTDAIYYEAANEGVAGQQAVAQVVINRVRDRHFPRSVCGVVYEGWERRTGCQFSFVCDGSIRRRRAEPVAWDRLRPIAEAALAGYVDRSVGAATHYHADYVLPYWRSSVAKITEIGRHIFYSWKGRAGLASALTAPYGGGEFEVAQAALDGVSPHRGSAPDVGCRRARSCPGEMRLARSEHSGRSRAHLRFGPVHAHYG